MDSLRFTGDFRDEGMTAHQLHRACLAGEWERIRRGAYAPPREWDDRERHLALIAATIPQIGSESVISHASAAILHGLPVPTALLGRVWVTRPAGGHGRRGPVLHLRRCRLDPSEVVLIGGVAVTSLARTAIDLARLQSHEWGVIACDAVLARGLDRGLLLASAQQTAGWPGAKKAVSAVLFADAAAQSPAESVSRVQLHRLGFPQPIIQFAVMNGGQLVATTDFGWEDQRLVGECDGKIKYGELLRPGETAADAVMREKRREERIRGAGYWIARWGWAEAWNPAVLRRIVERGFAMAPQARELRAS